MGLQKSKNKKKLDNIGEIHYFAEYSRNHSGKTYKMCNPKTGGVTIIRDIYWLNKMPNEVKSTEKIEKIESDDKVHEKLEHEKTKEIEVSENQPERRIPRIMTRSCFPMTFDLEESVSVMRSMSREKGSIGPKYK